MSIVKILKIASKLEKSAGEDKPIAGTYKKPSDYLGKKNLLEDKPHYQPLSEEQKKLQDEFYAKRMLEKEKAKKEEKKKLLKKEEEKEAEFEEKKRTKKEIIREVTQTHPEFESLFSFISYLNDNKKDAYSPKQLEMLSKLHDVGTKDLKEVLAAAGKFEMRMDRKVRTPSELIEEAAKKLGTNKQKVFDALLSHVSSPEDSPLSVDAVVEICKYKIHF